MKKLLEWLRFKFKTKNKIKEKDKREVGIRFLIEINKEGDIDKVELDLNNTKGIDENKAILSLVGLYHQFTNIIQEVFYGMLVNYQAAGVKIANNTVILINESRKEVFLKNKNEPVVSPLEVFGNRNGN